MKRRTYSRERPGCAVEATLDAIGGKYKGMLLYHLMEGTRRFGELRRLIPGVTHRTLAIQLRELEAVGVVRREVFAGVPPRVEYSLTDMGRALGLILRLMQEWGAEHLARIEQAGGEGPSAE